ncbi:MAG: HD domain-containing protein [Labilithrix sp.]|nr:HD domain-containing protein [Labilithrix sp.]
MIPRGVDPELWRRLAAEARARARESEPAHDFFHVERVVANAVAIARAEGAREAIAATAALLHELYTLPKSHPDSSSAGDVCAEHARELLAREAAPASLVEPVCAAIRDHAFSKGVVPDALESRVLQDADRLDALGAIGLARMWATCADMKRPFYAPDDPFCASRTPDDKRWGLDHVFKKLLVVPERLHLATSRELARERVRFLHAFLDQLRSEIAGGLGAG